METTRATAPRLGLDCTKGPRLPEIDQYPAPVAWVPLVGLIKGADGEAMGYRPGRQHVVELEERVGRGLPVEIPTDAIDIDSAPTTLIS